METTTNKFSDNLSFEHITKNRYGISKETTLLEKGSATLNVTNRVTPIKRGMSTEIIDATYLEDCFVEIRNKKKGSYGLYFFYTSQFVDVKLGGQMNLPTSTGYHVLLVEDDEAIEYFVEKGTFIHSVCVFVEKELAIKCFNQIEWGAHPIYSIIQSKKKVILFAKNLNRKSIQRLNMFEKESPTSPIYNLLTNGLVYSLIYNFLIQIQKDNCYFSNI